jgi:homogentisate 1,2-dioxygenase
MYQQSKGKVTPQAHVSIPEGTFEDEHGRNGFYGRVSHLYHTHAPTNWKRIEGPCRPQAFNLYKLVKNKDPWQPTFLLANEDVKIGFMQPPSEAMPYLFRNADGDVAYFIHSGGGTLETDFGVIQYTRGDYVIVPKGTTIRFNVDKTEQKYFIVESKAEMNLPDKGLLGKHALFDIGMLETPTPIVEAGPALSGRKQEFEMRIKRENEFTKVFYDFNPLDVVGWKGDLTVVKVNIKDFRPVGSHRFHVAPSVHSTFLGQGFVICSFVPRPFETDEQANRVPFYHRNIDCDEVIFYHDGDFFSRKDMGAGMVTFHPFGIHHGPHPKAAAAAKEKTMTNEYAVMVDTYKPLHPTAEARQCEATEYHMSWKE